MRKKLFAILMSAMMMVTFMPAMAFAADAESGVTHEYTIQSINWNANYTKADITVKDVATVVESGKTTTTETTVPNVVPVETGYHDAVLYRVESFWNAEDDFSKMIPALEAAGYPVHFNNYETAPLTRFDMSYATGVSADAEKKVMDLSEATVVLAGSASADAATYSLWYEKYAATGDAGKAAMTPDTANLAVTGLTFQVSGDANSSTVPTTYFKVDYPAYYAFNTGSDAIGKITVAPSSTFASGNAGVVVLGTNVQKTVEFVIGDLGDYEDYHFVSGTLSANPANRDYDGNTWTVEMVHPAKNMTVEYALVATGDGEHDTFADLSGAAWKSEVSFKDAAQYTLGVKLTVGAKVVKFEKEFKVGQRDVTLGLRNADFLKKTYDGKGFQLKDSDFSVVEGFVATGDSVFNGKELTKAEVGKHIVLASEFTSALNANPNYNVTLVGMPHAFSSVVEIAKATSNKVTLKAQTVKKNKTIKATAKLGTVKFTKKSGNKKIKVSKAGKVTVKKGLKKGTYKVKVKAYVSGTDNFVGASATKTIKVKVK